MDFTFLPENRVMVKTNILRNEFFFSEYLCVLLLSDYSMDIFINKTIMMGERVDIL